MVVAIITRKYYNYLPRCLQLMGFSNNIRLITRFPSRVRDLQKSGINVVEIVEYPYTITADNDKYLQIITQFKTSSIPMTDLVLHQSWNTYMNNYATEENYTYSSIISGLTTTINQYTQLSFNILDWLSLKFLK